MSNARDRVISVVLTDAEWRAFLDSQPRPVAWLRERIVEAITSSSPNSSDDAAYTTSARSH
jgi:hypothetical protein